MFVKKSIKIGHKKITALALGLLSKKLIIIRGSRGYIMCGYLDLKVAEKFGDVAVKITGASTIKDALNAKVAACTSHAKALGIHKDQSIRSVLGLIA